MGASQNSLALNFCFKMKKILLFLSLALTLAACNSEETKTSAPEKKTNPKALNVALMPVIDCLPVYYAEQTGIYDSLGLELSITDKLSLFDLDAQMDVKTTDGIFTDVARVQYNKSKGKEWTVVMATNGKWALVANKNQRFTKVDQLTDWIVSISRYSASDFLAAQALKQNNMKYDDALRVQVNSLEVRLNMLNNNQVETAVLPQPFLARATEKGHKVLMAYEGADNNLGCIAFKKTALTDKRKAKQVELFVKGYNRAADIINRKGRKACDSLLIKHYNVPAKALPKVVLPKYEHARLPIDPTFTDVSNMLYEINAIKHTFGLYETCDERFLKQ